MVKDVLKRFSTLALAALMVLTMLPVMAMAADLSGLTDTTIGLNAGSSGTWKAIGTRITGSINGDGCNSSATTLTITNKRQIKANLLFDYEVNLNSGTVTIDGTAISTNGSFQKELGPDETVEIKLASNSSNALETTIGINNIRMIEDKSVTVTFTPAENGVYTVNGSSVAENFSLTQSSLTAFALSATPNDGYIFVGWYDKTNDKYLRGGSNADVLIPYDCEVTAKFVETGSVFGVGTEKFDDLETAVNYAVGNGISQVTLLKDHTITGNYTIPQGITLLIPFDDAGTLYTDSPAAIRTQPASKPFRTLTMAAGSSITVNGAMSIGGRYFAAGGGQQGRPTGDHGYIKMASGSSITVKNGGNLYAWGFISGDGSVTAESGATVYEFYQIADFRGGSASFRMVNKVFPFSQYFIQNIEVPLTLNAGATEKVFSGVYAMDTTNTTTINFIGSDGMFNIKSGSFTKDYDENNDRLILMVNGEAELNTLALKLAGMSVDSAEYVLPMTNNITINIDSGSVTINQDTALLAGVEVNIAEGAGLTVASGKNVYVYDADEWNAESYVCGSSKFKSVWYAPGKKYSRSNADLVDAKVTVNGTLTVNGAMYTTAGGANICSDGTGKYVQNATPGTEKVTYQYTQSGSSVTAHEITITPAKLRNADGTYFETATVEAGTTVNYYKDGGIWHVHNSVKVDAKEATCTEKGNTDGTKCSVCNKILSGVEEIPANGHQWDKGSITTAPTCTEDGVKTFTCLVCDATKTEKVEKKGHISAEAVRENEIKSTCTVKGSYDEVVYCKVCGNVISRVTKTIDALGHTPGEAKRENVVEPSCMVDGRYEEVVYCSVCNDEISRVNKTIDATGHTPVEVSEVPATCTEPGKKAGTKCDVCGEELSGFEAIPPAGHQWDEGKVTTEPTCEGTGVKTFTCSNCQEKRYEDIPATGHQWDEGKVTTEPKCEEAGVKTYTCKVCKETKTEAIDATGHTPVEVPEVPATCTEPGKKAGTKCSVCDTILSGVEEIPAKGHQWNDGEITTAPTCTEKGVKTYTCSVCKETKTEKIDKTNDHTPGEAQRENVKEATCTKDGSYDEVVRCKVCNKELSREPKTITSPGHQWDEGVVTKEPTCAAEGEKTFTCTVCKETKTEAIDPKGHTPVDVAAKDATCTEKGNTAGTKCSVCDTILSGVEEIPAKGHQWNDGEITTAPTCTEKGVKTYTCTVCNTTKTEAIDATGHTPVDVAAKDATCTEKGNTAGTKCSVCDTILSGVEEIPAKGHQWNDGEITTAPTCTEKGVKTYTCKVCKETKTEAIDATGHTPVEVPEVPATCTEPGKKAGTKCSVCNKILSGVEEIPAKGHTPGKAVKESVVLATCEAAGSYEEVVYCEVCKEELTRVSKTLPAMGHTRGEAVRENVIDSTCADEGSCDEVVYCEVCKKELSREAKVIEKKAHTPVDVAEVPATCTEPGTTAGTKCDVCGTILSGVKEIPANGHTEVIRNAKPATDTEDGYTGDVYCEVCNELLRNGEVIPATHVKITWIINGVKHETVCAKGEIPVYDGETPAKPETSRFTYEFKGWDKEIVAATENAEYTAEFTAIGKNGLCIEGNDTFWIKNGVNIAFPGLIRIADENGHIHYYYFAEDGKAVKNGNYKVNKNNGLPLPEYGFAFDSDGVIVHDEDTSKNGICDGDGSKFYYIDGVKVGEGLIKVGDYYYYARTSSGEIVRNRQYWITKTNELPIQQGIFDFDAEGRMIVTGFIHAFGATYYYDNGVLAKGFTKIGDDYYIFNASSGKMYSNAMMWVPDNEYGITGGMYEFDADGKMIRTGFITTGGYTYYYDNGVLAKGFTKIGDDYYFFNAGSGKMYRDATLWVADNAEYGFVGGMYYFGADGKMVLPDIENGKKSIVTINGKKYLTIDGAYAPTGLYEIDGNCYYVKAAGELAVGETVWVDNKNGLIPAKGDWRAFDAEGKLIHTGFVTGGDGYVYHYTDDVLSLGFTCIDGEYYLFNAGSGKMYRDANMWVGPNDYGIVGGMYYFDANGKMAR